MIRLLFNLVLLISFLVNGLAGASAHQAHADRQPCAHATTPMDHAAMGHAGHQEMLRQLHSSTADQAPVDGAGCCGETGCQCGCTLPTAVIAPGITVAPQATADAPSIAPVAHALIRRSAAPFRPPTF